MTTFCTIFISHPLTCSLIERFLYVVAIPFYVGTIRKLPIFLILISQNPLFPQLLFLYFGFKLLNEARQMEGSGPSDELQEVEEELIHKKEGGKSSDISFP